MGNRYGPKIINDGLVLCIDAAGDNKSYPIDGLDVEYLIVSGGGAGGGGGGGGGAGGWILGSTKATISTGTYPMVIGAGGTGYSSNTPGTDGGISSAFGISPSGGGGGGAMYGDNARDGASGGGGNLQSAGGESVAGQGNNGGDGAVNTGPGWNVGGGGGGAGTVGMAAHVRGTNKAGSGGTGKYFGDKFSNSIGESGWLSGGGGGGTQAGTQNGGLAGLGGGGYGGGNGTYVYRAPGQDGDANSGGGGGAGNEGGGVFGKSGNGGSGVVLIRYSGPPRAKGGDSIISHNGYTIHVFNSSGNFIVGETVSDLSTSKKYGTLTNMATSDYTSGRSGYFSFDGSNQYIDCGVDNTLFKFSAGDSISLIAAVKATNINQQTYQAFFTIGGDPNITRDRSYQMRVANYSGAGKIDALYRNSSNTNWHTIKTNSAYVSNNQWIIIASTYTYGTGSSWKIYVNGNPVATSFNSGNGNENPIVNTNQIFVGIGEDANNTGEQWYGQIGFVQMYRSYLTADQILNNFNAVRGRYGL